MSPWANDTTKLGIGDLKWMLAFCLNFLQYIPLHAMEDEVAETSQWVVAGIHWITLALMAYVNARPAFINVYAFCLIPVTFSLFLSLLTSAWWVSTLMWVGIMSISVCTYHNKKRTGTMLAMLLMYSNAWTGVVYTIARIIQFAAKSTARDTTDTTGTRGTEATATVASTTTGTENYMPIIVF